VINRDVRSLISAVIGHMLVEFGKTSLSKKECADSSPTS